MKTIIFLLLFFASWNINNDFGQIDKSIDGNFIEVEKSDFDGLWINVNEERPGITKCKISYENNSFIVQMWGNCQPQDCDWGENIANEVKKGTNKFELIWDSGFAESSITYEIINGQLKMMQKRHFKDNSGRQDYEIVEYFVKQ